MSNLKKTIALFRCLPNELEYFKIVNIEIVEKVVAVDIEIRDDNDQLHRLYLNAVFSPAKKMLSMYTRITFTLADNSVVNAFETLNDLQCALFNEDDVCSVVSTCDPDESNGTDFFVYSNQYLPARFLDGDPSEKSILACKHLLTQFVDCYSSIFNFLFKNLPLEVRIESRSRLN